MIIYVSEIIYECENYDNGMCPYFLEMVNDYHNHSPNTISTGIKLYLCPKVTQLDPHPICVERKIVEKEFKKSK